MMGKSSITQEIFNTQAREENCCVSKSLVEKFFWCHNDVICKVRTLVCGQANNQKFIIAAMQ